MRSKLSAGLILAAILVPAALGQTLTITSPANNTQVQPGATVKFTVTVNPVSDFGAVTLYGTSPLGLIGGQLAAASLSFSVTLPSDLKSASYPVTAIGYTTTGSVVLSPAVTLAVAAAAPTSMHVNPAQMFFTSIGAQLPALAGGTYPDGTVQDLTESPSVTWRSGNTKVAVVSTDGLVQAVGNGSAVVTAGYGSVSGNVTVSVAAPALPCTYSVDTPTANAGSSGGSITVNVRTNSAACEWSAVSWAPWLAVTAGKLGLGPGPVTLAITGNTGAARTATVAIAGGTVVISQVASTGPSTVPGIAANGVVNGASFASGGIVPGEIATIFGANLTTATGINLASGLPLQTEFMGVEVLVNQTPAPIFAVDNVNGQQQINFQVPFGAASIATASVQVVSKGLAGNTVSVPVIVQPGIFAYSTGMNLYGAILHADYSLASSSSPAATGETVLIYCTGLGPVMATPMDGAAATGADPTVFTPAVTIGAASAAVTYSGLAPGFVGLYQINVVVPAGLGSGDQPVVITEGGVRSAAALLPVQ